MKIVMLALAGIFSLGAYEPVASGAKVYIHPFGGFGPYLNAAFRVKGVPLIQVSDRAIADYEVVGSSESEKAGWAKIIFLKQTGSREEASISVIDVRTSEVVFAYNYNTGNSYRGKQSAAESCAKHLERHIRAGGRLSSSLPVRSDTEIRAARLQYYAETPEGQAAARVVARTPVEPKTISVRFTSNPGNAELEVDGEYWGTTPTAELTRLREGSHVIVVKKPGYQKWERKVNLGVGEVRMVHADLQEEPAVGGRPRIAGLQ